MPKSRFVLTAVLCSILLAGCGGTTVNRPPGSSGTFSFENDLQGWTPRATDVFEAGNPPAVATWSIQPSQERASDGGSSLRLTVSNLTDAAKVWIERDFTVTPNRRYRVKVQYALASADFGDINLWRIITGVAPSSPQTRDDLTYQDTTGNGSDAPGGYTWLEKSYDLDATSGADGRLYVTIGVWGTSEHPRTYYLDNVRITISPQ